MPSSRNTFFIYFFFLSAAAPRTTTNHAALRLRLLRCYSPTMFRLAPGKTLAFRIAALYLYIMMKPKKNHSLFPQMIFSATNSLEFNVFFRYYIYDLFIIYVNPRDHPLTNICSRWISVDTIWLSFLKSVQSSFNSKTQTSPPDFTR